MRDLLSVVCLGVRAYQSPDAWYGGNAAHAARYQSPSE